jgi:uncharacterized OB-fold protein
MDTTIRQYRERHQKHGLKRSRCTECDTITAVTATNCHQCGSSDLTETTLTPQGEVLTFIVQTLLPDEFDTPLPIGIVETPDGGKVLGMFTEVDDPFEDVEIGQQVEIELKRTITQNEKTIFEPAFRLVSDGGNEDD